MLYDPIVPQLGLLDPSNLPAGFTTLRDFKNPVTEARMVIHARGSYICILNSSEDFDGSPLQSQIEIPREGCLWLADSIQHKFWKPIEAGGLPDNVFRIKETFRGEIIYLRRMMNCGDQGVKGFELCNFNRRSYISSDLEQSAQLQDVLLLDFGLLSLFRELGSTAV